jgi:hypothetical protein
MNNAGFQSDGRFIDVRMMGNVVFRDFNPEAPPQTPPKGQWPFGIPLDASKDFRGAGENPKGQVNPASLNCIK